MKQCPLCDKVFINQAFLNDHMQRRHCKEWSDTSQGNLKGNSYYDGSEFDSNHFFSGFFHPNNSYFKQHKLSFASNGSFQENFKNDEPLNENAIETSDAQLSNNNNQNNEIPKKLSRAPKDKKRGAETDVEVDVLAMQCEELLVKSSSLLSRLEHLPKEQNNANNKNNSNENTESHKNFLVGDTTENFSNEQLNIAQKQVQLLKQFRTSLKHFFLLKSQDNRINLLHQQQLNRLQQQILSLRQQLNVCEEAANEEQQRHTTEVETLCDKMLVERSSIVSTFVRWGKQVLN